MSHPALSIGSSRVNSSGNADSSAEEATDSSREAVRKSGIRALTMYRLWDLEHMLDLAHSIHLTSGNETHRTV